jgi:hypothetical protein
VAPDNPHGWPTICARNLGAGSSGHETTDIAGTKVLLSTYTGGGATDTVTPPAPFREGVLSTRYCAGTASIRFKIY